MNENFKKRFDRIRQRLAILCSVLVVYFSIALLMPSSPIGIHLALQALEFVAQVNHPNMESYVAGALRATTVRFSLIVMMVIVISIGLIIVFHRWSWGRILLDQFSESFRTVPATAWAFPLAIIPINFLQAEHALYVATIFSTVPILTLGLLQKCTDVHDSVAFVLATKNGKSANKIISRNFWPWLLGHSIVHVKTTVSLIFIIVIVLEAVLQSSTVRSGLGIIMSELNNSRIEMFSAEILLLVLLATISVSISTFLDLIDMFVLEKG